MSVVSEIERIKTNIANAYTEIENKGVITTNTKNSENLATVISAIQTGGTTGGGDAEIEAGFISLIDTSKGANVTKLPDSITSLKSSAFSGLTNLNLHTLPAGITEIPSSCFYNCSKMTELTCLGNITTINANSFYSCTELKKFIMPNITSIPTLANKNAFSYVNFDYGSGGIYVPDKFVGTMKGTTNWSNYQNYIKPISSLEG